MLMETNGSDIQESGSESERFELVIPWIGQKPYQNWCWAACCAMILTADGSPTTLYDAAKAVLGDPPPDDPIYPSEALTRVGLSWKQPPGDGGAPLSRNSLREQVVDGRKPAELYWEYEDGTGHVGLVTGFDPLRQTWCLLDPLDGKGWISYDLLLTYKGAASWQNTFYAIGASLGHSS
jgi:hypothetical protein